MIKEKFIKNTKILFNLFIVFIICFTIGCNFNIEEKDTTKEYVDGLYQEILNTIDVDNVTEDIYIPDLYKGATITIESSNPSIVNIDGTVNRTAEDELVNLTLTFEYNGKTYEKVLQVVVPAQEEELTDGEISVEQQISNIKNDLKNVLDLANDYINEDIEFKTTSLYDSVIVWSTSDASIISLDGVVNKNLSSTTKVTIGYQIILDGVEYDFVYITIYVLGKGTYIAYYSAAEGKNGTALFNELRRIISSTHKKTTTYAELKKYLQEADEDPNNSNNMLLFYTGESIKKSDNMNIWNREHVWPQSKGWFQTSGAGADMHHLRPCDPSVNSSRGNKRFGTGSGDFVANKYGVDYRGDVARILFYLFTRYNEADSYSWTTVAQSRELLLEWHRLDPVSETEIIRNNYTATIQGNRNPFIDYPEFADLIW